VLAKARQARVDARRGVAATGSNMTTEAYLRRWLEHVQPALRARTFSSYSARCRLYIIPAVGRVRLAQLTPGHVERMLAKLLRSGLSATTVAHVRGTLCLMGHSMLSATESYAHTIPASLDRDMASVDQAL
jgi:integrase